MARGKSGRVVLEIDPELKRNLYLELEKRQKTLKDWFVAEAEKLIYNGDQIDLFIPRQPDKEKDSTRKIRKSRKK